MPASPNLVAALRIVDPAGADDQFVLVDRPVLHIGSARDECGLALVGHGISDHHCTLRWHAPRWVLYHRGAPAGTYVNSRRCSEPTALCPGDRISIAHHLIHFTTLPSLELSHVLTRLHDRPIRWIPERPAIPDPAPPPAKPRRRAPLRTVALVALGLVATAHARDPEPLAAPHLVEETAATLPDLIIIPSVSRDLSRQTAPPSELDLSSGPAIIAALAPRSLLRGLSSPPSAHIPSAITDLSSPPSAHIASAITSPIPAPTTFVTEPPTFELPPDAVGLGRPTDGAILHALQLPSSPDYTIRCPAHAHATTATIAELMHALARMRNNGYTGELVVGDLSRRDGGQYGPHKSHQSGRDVDLWLPIVGGHYLRGCWRCGTDLCRPEPGQVDWRATWRLIQSLAERGAVEDIFLDWTLHPLLASAAHDLGVPPDEILRQIQHPIRGRATLIKHSDGHVHHMHVRFREPPPV